MSTTDTTAARPEVARFAARLDNVPVSRFHLRILPLSGLGRMFDALAILIVGALPEFPVVALRRGHGPGQ